MLFRHKRAAAVDDTLLSPSVRMSNLLNVISNKRITSSDSAGSPPDQPLHEHSTFPTPGNISEEMAINLCRGAVEQTDLYDDCLNYTAIDTQHYVRSCVEDIKVSCLLLL